MIHESGTFECGQTAVDSGERLHFHYEISETYLSDTVRIPVTVINGSEPGPVVFLAAAIHGDELNGVEVVRHVADEFDHGSLHGTLICLHVLNVPGFNAQERYLPLDDSDLNRSFPGDSTGAAAERIAGELYETFIRQCDFGVDFHTSTRGRTNLLHVRGNLNDDEVDRLARSFSTNIVLGERGPPGSLRRVATANGTPTITVEMGEAKRFQRDLIDRALDGVKSMFAEFGVHPERVVRWPGWRTVVTGNKRKRWIRAENGGIVELEVTGGTVVPTGGLLCTITDPFEKTLVEVTAPFTSVVVGVLENPVVSPGNPLCHLVEVDETMQAVIESQTELAPKQCDKHSTKG